MTNDERPPVTFALFAYNQEKYIREAVESAFSQTYRPLEIILSDDCSRDRTFEIMQEMAAAYPGPHKVLVRKSDQNRGLIEHVNAVASVAASDYLVVASGDDVSFSHRTVTAMKAFLADSKTMAVFSRVADINCADIVPLEKNVTFTQISLFEMALNAGGMGKGAAYAYRRECFFWPAPIPEDITSEDRVLPFRAGLIGHVYLCDRELVKKRVSSFSLSQLLTSSNRLARDLRSHWLMLSELAMIAKQQGKISLICFLFLNHVFFVVEARQGIINGVRSRNYYMLRIFRSVLYLPLRIARKLIRRRRSVF